VRPLLLLLLLALTWLLWSGVTTPVMLGVGLASCGIALYLAHRMGFFRSGIYALHVAARLPAFWAWLLVEIVKANLAVAAAVLGPRSRIRPSIVDVRTRSGPIAQTLLANAITLTPGTVTLDVNEGLLRVHCLTRESAEELRSGRMESRVSAVTSD
jgi:multicomponent Na+:H+ antiporter subunit E